MCFSKLYTVLSYVTRAEETFREWEIVKLRTYRYGFLNV